MTHDYDLMYRRRLVTRKTSRPLWKILLVGFFAVLALFFLINRVTGKTGDANSGQVKNLQPAVVSPSAKEQTLISQIKSEFEGKVGTYSIYVYDLNTNTSYGIHEKTILTAASVAKVPIVAALYHLANSGEIDLDKTIALSQKDIQDFGTGTLRYAEPGTIYSLKTLTRLMMEKSDNTAAYILGRQIVGFPKTQELIESWGLTQTSMENNKTSAHDMSILMNKMYRGELAREALTKEMLGFMTNTDFEDRIPALLPKETKIYHKTGDEIGNTHDVAIIQTENSTYYLGILALDLLSGEEEAKKTIAKVSKMIFDFQNQKTLEQERTELRGKLSS